MIPQLKNPSLLLIIVAIICVCMGLYLGTRIPTTRNKESEKRIKTRDEEIKELKSKLYAKDEEFKRILDSLDRKDEQIAKERERRELAEKEIIRSRSVRKKELKHMTADSLQEVIIRRYTK